MSGLITKTLTCNCAQRVQKPESFQGSRAEQIGQSIPCLQLGMGFQQSEQAPISYQLLSVGVSKKLPSKCFDEQALKVNFEDLKASKGFP